MTVSCYSTFYLIVTFSKYVHEWRKENPTSLNTFLYSSYHNSPPRGTGFDFSFLLFAGGKNTAPARAARRKRRRRKARA